MQQMIDSVTRGIPFVTTGYLDIETIDPANDDKNGGIDIPMEKQTDNKGSKYPSVRAAVQQAPIKPVFVFGSNESGFHGSGAARYAELHHGAVRGVGFGPQGDSWAIPTKDWNIETLAYTDVRFYVESFLRYAADRPNRTFHLTQIGCGLAGFTPAAISKLFIHAPANVLLINDEGLVVMPAAKWYTSEMGRRTTPNSIK